MENERFSITLENANNTYYAGETIRGSIRMNLQKNTKIRAVKVQITGKGKCKWIEILRKNSSGSESTRSLFYSSKEIYAHNENPLPVFEPRGIELGYGLHTFAFTVPLEWNLPSSFKGSHGSIKYKLRIIIQRPWTFDERHTIPLTIIKNMPLPISFRSNPTSYERQITKTISLFGTRPITMLGLLPVDFAVRGEPLRLCVTVTNNSTTNVEKMRFTVLQNIWYYSHVPLRSLKKEVITIATKETGAVAKKSERVFAHELIIPALAQPTDDELSGVINISYEVRVEAVLRGFFRNIILNLPFKVYSNEMQEILSEEPSNSAVNGGGDVAAITAGNPFEASTPALPIYPSLEGTVGSPTHSMQQSESSSINSTTSDSSAATLSPAVGGYELSCASGSSSSQFNSPSLRASMRSVSNVPYMPYSNSPLMINSYPPPHLSPYPPLSHNDSPQYTLLTHSHGTPPPTAQFNHYNITMAVASRLHGHGRVQQPPAGAHELPPSYEELFGSATAPPESNK